MLRGSDIASNKGHFYLRHIPVLHQSMQQPIVRKQNNIGVTPILRTISNLLHLTYIRPVDRKKQSKIFDNTKDA